MPRRRRGEARDLVGPLEYRVLEVLWSQGSATVAEALANLNQTAPELAYTTVMTVLTRMHDKELVLREKDGRGFRYAPRHSEDDLVGILAGREVDRLIDRFGDVALAKFATRLEDVDPGLMSRLRELAEETPDA